MRGKILNLHISLQDCFDLLAQLLSFECILLFSSMHEILYCSNLLEIKIVNFWGTGGDISPSNEATSILVFDF